VARPVWRHLDLTPHVVYVANVLERTIKEDMHEESRPSPHLSDVASKVYSRDLFGVDG